MQCTLHYVTVLNIIIIIIITITIVAIMFNNIAEPRSRGGRCGRRCPREETYVCIYIYICMYMHIHVYIYIYRERERHVPTYTHIYIYTVGDIVYTIGITYGA